MNAATRHKPRAQNASSSLRAATFLPLLVASASAATLIAAPAHALELGQIQVDSTLGQPLRASIKYALNPAEELYDFCISLTKSPTLGGLPNVTRAKISVADNRILIHGPVPIKEPLLAMRLTVDCPYTAHLSRQFTLMLDPQVTLTISGNAPVASVSTTAPSAIGARPAVSVAARRTTVNDSPLTAGIQYRVQIGDTLSEIAGRIENRPVGLWIAVQQIFDANPKAFIDGDINRLAAGYLLTIPFLQEGALVATPAPAARQTPPALAEPPSSAISVNSYDAFSAPVSVAEETPPAGQASEELAEPELSASDAAPDAMSYGEAANEITDDTAILSAGAGQPPETVTEEAGKVAVAQPGDVFVGADIPADAEIEAQRPASVVAIPPEESAGTPSWLMWVLGGGLALVAGLLVFGRGLRKRFGVAAQPVPGRRATDNDPTATNKALSDVDFQFDDPVPGNVDMVLDADLGVGTGLLEGDEMDVAQDFGFSATANASDELDMEFPDDSGDVTAAVPTDIIPPRRQDSVAILDQEILPDEHDDGDYDLSMIVDATKQAIADPDGTAKELNAVQIDAEPLVDYGGESLSQEIDLNVLEQDYQDELTATQALNKEIEKAAMELALRMDVDHTAEMPAPAGTYPDAELTTEMPMPAAENDDVGGDLDDTGVNEELTANMRVDDDTGVNEGLTANMRIDDDTGVNEELTENMRLDDETGTNEVLTVDVIMDDATVEMDIESGTLDTKKIAG